MQVLFAEKRALGDNKMRGCDNIPDLGPGLYLTTGGTNKWLKKKNSSIL